MFYFIRIFAKNIRHLEKSKVQSERKYYIKCEIKAYKSEILSQKFNLE